MDQVWWNGDPAEGRRVRVIVADCETQTDYWARQYVNTARDAVEVTYQGRTFYLDDQDGEGYAKVTQGKGAPYWPHRGLCVKEVLEDRDAPVRVPQPERRLSAT